MLDSSIINGRTARTTFFIMFVGGLYFLSSYLLSLLCNKLIFGVFQMPCINTLESSGIIAFLFIIFFGIKFGLKYKDNSDFSNKMGNQLNNPNNHSFSDKYFGHQTNLSYQSNSNAFDENIINDNNIEENITFDTYQNINTNQKTSNTTKQSITKSNINANINKIENQINNQINIAKNKIKLSKENSNCLKKIEQMTDEQKKQLQLTLAKSCGIQINDEKKFV